MVDLALAIDDKLRAMTRVIVDACAPRRVVLFGSRARGDARIDSDYDIFVEADDGSPVDELRNTIYACLRRGGLSAEVFVRTATEFARRATQVGYLDYDIAQDGRTLYTRPDVVETTAPQRPTPRVRERTPGRSDTVALWVRRALWDLQEIENSLGSSTPAPPPICFHAHECAEKLLKALIVMEGDRPPRTHDLDDLIKLCPQKVKSDRGIVEACTLLSTLWPRSRYPDDAEPTIEEAREAAVAARIVRARVMPLLLR